MKKSSDAATHSNAHRRSNFSFDDSFYSATLQKITLPRMTTTSLSLAVHMFWLDDARAYGRVTGYGFFRALAIFDQLKRKL